MNTKTQITLGITAAILVLSVFLSFLLCLNHVDVNEFGVARNSWSGELTIQTNAGWHVTSPLVKVMNISTLPQRVEIPSQANVVNVKIVRFVPEPEAVKDFIALQGFSYTVSGSLNNILLGYAFSGQDYSFFEIIQEGSKGNAPKSHR